MGPGSTGRLARVAAALLAELTVTVLHVARRAWLDQPDAVSTADLPTTCLDRLRRLLSPGPVAVV